MRSASEHWRKQSKTMPPGKSPCESKVLVLNAGRISQKGALEMVDDFNVCTLFASASSGDEFSAVTAAVLAPTNAEGMLHRVYRIDVLYGLRTKINGTERRKCYCAASTEYTNTATHCFENSVSILDWLSSNCTCSTAKQCRDAAQSLLVI